MVMLQGLCQCHSSVVTGDKWITMSPASFWECLWLVVAMTTLSLAFNVTAYLRSEKMVEFSAYAVESSFVHVSFIGLPEKKKLFKHVYMYKDKNMKKPKNGGWVMFNYKTVKYLIIFYNQKMYEIKWIYQCH